MKFTDLFNSKPLYFSELSLIIFLLFIGIFPMYAFADEQFDQLVNEIAEKCVKKYSDDGEAEIDTTSFESVKSCIQNESERQKDKVHNRHPDIVFGGHTQQSILYKTSLQKAVGVVNKITTDNEKSLMIKHKNSAIKIIQEHYLDSYSQSQGYPPFGKALDSFFSKPSWEVTEDGAGWTVIFNGIAKWGENNARFTWIFNISPKFKNGKIDNYSFSYSATVNNNKVSNKVMNDMIGTIYLN